ncbi:MAG: hypothetical protein V1738_06935 [Patescibacteria group bacterium]
MGKNGLIKLLAAGALVGAAVHMINKVENKDKKKTALTKAASKVGKLAKDHATKVGKMTKDNFNGIIDTVVSEFKETKDVSKDELNELKRELKNSWSEVKDIFTDRPSKKIAKKK